jgi:23S rRNA-/tRNA-specific pseudouridylate synthase
VAASSRKALVNAIDVEDQLLELYDIKILHESQEEVIVNKPSGMTCFHNRITTSGKVPQKKQKQSKTDSTDISLESALLQFGIPLSTLNAEARGLAHRIDRGTSWCLVPAKTDDRHAKLGSDFFLRRVKKSYQASMQINDVDIAESGTIDLPVTGRPAPSTYRIEER